jgi:spermidine synthase
LEINEQVIKAAQFFNDWNNHFSKDRRIRVVVQDGRNHLLLSRIHYDVVISEPSNPWMAGMANLYTKESFETIKDRLNNDGIFIQWVDAGRMDWQTLAMIGKTFGTVFPNSLMMISPIGGSDFFFVGVKGEVPLRLSVADQNLSFASRSRIMKLADTRLLFHLILTDRVAEMFADGVIHSDNRPHLEFAAPRHLYTLSQGFMAELKQRRRISPATASIIASSRDLDMVLNLAELSTSLFAMEFPVVDLSDATPEQTARYKQLVKEFCAKRVIKDYMTFYDDRSREICADVQIEFIERHLADTPNDVNAWGDLGVVYAKRSEFDKAEKALERYIAGKPEEPNAYFRMGVLLIIQKSYSRARKQFLKTVSLNPGHAEALLYLAKLNLLEGDKAAAVKRLRQVLEVDESPEAKALLRQIEQDG